MTFSLYNLHTDPKTLYKYNDALKKLPYEAYSAAFIKKSTLDDKTKKEYEKAIAKDAKYSYLYAKRVLQGRFLEGESTIAKDAHYAYLYTKYLDEYFEEKFPEGESAISKDPWTAVEYAIHIIHGRWPPGEHAISTQPDTAYLYALEVIEGRWPMGEPAIKKDESFYVNYQEYLRDLRNMK